MEITEVRIKLMDDPHERLQAFCSITLDHAFVIRDLKIIQGIKGPFVAMPSRKLTDRCPRCHSKNHLRSNYCNQCGAKLDEERALRDPEGRARLYADIAHPINCECRELIQRCVIHAFDEELVRSQQPGYVCTYEDYGEERYATLLDPEEQAALSESIGHEEGRVGVAGSRPFRNPTGDRIRRIDPAHAVAGPHDGRALDPAAVSVANESRDFGKSTQTASRNEDSDEPFGAGLD